MKNKIILFGSGGHAKVILEILEDLAYEIVGFIDSYEKKGIIKYGYPVLGDENQISFICESYKTNSLVIGVGDNYDRNTIYHKLISMHNSLEFPTIISPHSRVSDRSSLGMGTVVMEGVIIHPGCEIGEFVVVNTSALLEHDCKINNFVSIAPRVSLGGAVSIGLNSYIGVASTIIQKRKIGADSVVGAGAIVTKDMPDRVLITGIPAIIKKYNYTNRNILK